MYSLSIYKMGVVLIFILRLLGGLISTRKVFRMLPSTKDPPQSLATTVVIIIALSSQGPQETMRTGTVAEEHFLGRALALTLHLQVTLAKRATAC